MVQVILSDGTIIKDVPNSMLEQIYPKELQDTDEILLSFVKPDNFIIFDENYDKIINNEELPLDVTIICLNVSIALQLYDIVEELKQRIIDGFNNFEYLESLKPYKMQILEVLSELQPDISYEIISHIEQFYIDYQIDNAKISRAGLDLSVIVDAIYESDRYKFNIYKNGIIDRTTYDTNEERRGKRIIPRQLLGVTSNGEVILAPIKDAKMARDGSKYLDISQTMHYDTLYDINGNLIKDKIKINIRNFSPNLNYVVHYNYDNPTEYWNDNPRRTSSNYIITNVNTLSYFSVDVGILNDFTFSPDEKYVGFFNEINLKIFETDTGKEITEISTINNIYFDGVYISNSLIFIYSEIKTGLSYLSITDNDLNNAKSFPFEYNQTMRVTIGTNDSIGFNFYGEEKKVIVYRYISSLDTTLVEAVDILLT